MMGLDQMVAEVGQPVFWLAVLQIIWINILLSGDNAVVIAMACRNLPDRVRNWGIALGAGVAVLLRIIFTGVVATILSLPWLKFVGGLALLYIAIDLVKPDDGDSHSKIKSHDSLMRAVGTVAVADIVMSLDNVVAIAAVAKGSWTLLILGLAISIPMIVVGAALITALFVRYPILIWGGAALLGWIAGDIMISDPAIVERVSAAVVMRYDMLAAGAGATFVVAFGYIRRKMNEASAKPKRITKVLRVNTARKKKAPARVRARR
jgi:YjbE family integral membrane protein